MGMGEIEVHSYLNQPFNAEIPLTDIDGISLDNIRVNLASVEEYARIGLTSNEILSFLRFAVKKDPNGQPIIVITSTERISDPYLQIVVDLTWPSGQIYRAYTILLDPPGYKVKKSRLVTDSKKLNINKTDIGEPGVVDKPVYQDINGKISNETSEATYGPTLANESIWQIAQRYKTAETTLPQVVLAIVGANLDAFKEGNLNGLKVGERLKIPASEQIVQIPIQLAVEEVAAHDLAWQGKQEIKHVIFPPYINKSATTSKVKVSGTIYYESKIAPIPKFNLETTSLSNDAASLPAPEVFFTASNTAIPSITQKSSKKLSSQSSDVTISAGLGVTLAAIDTIRTENSLIKDQLDKLKADNNRLQQQVKKQQKEMAILQEQLKVIMQERQGLHAQTSSLNSSDGFPWLYWLIMGGSSIVILYGLLYWLWLRRREEKELNEDAETTIIVPPTVNNSYLNRTTLSENDHSQANAEITDVEESTEAPKNSVVEPLIVQKMQADSPTFITEDEPVQVVENKKDKEKLKNTQSEPLDLSQHNETIKTDQINTPVSLLNSTDRVENDEPQSVNNQITEKPPSISQAPVTPPESAKAVSIDEVNNSIMAANPSQASLTENNTPSAEINTEQENNYLANELGSDAEQDSLMPSDEHGNDIQQPTDSHMPYKLNNEGDYAVDFEPGLDKLIQPKPKKMIRDEQSLDFVIDEQVENLLKNIKPKADATSANTETSVPLVNEASLDTNNENLSDSHETLNTEQIGSIDQMKSKNNAAENANTDDSKSESSLVKSQAALNTLLSLAETYIAMEDFESAEQSLEEVIKFGNDEQKAQAQKLLGKLNK